MRPWRRGRHSTGYVVSPAGGEEMSDDLSAEDVTRIEQTIEIGRKQKRERKDSAAKAAAGGQEVSDAARRMD